METPSLTRKSVSGVSFLTDGHAEGQVCFGFTERTGGGAEGVVASRRRGEGGGGWTGICAVVSARGVAGRG